MTSNTKKIGIMLVMLALIIAIISGCKGDNNNNNAPPNQPGDTVKEGTEGVGEGPAGEPTVIVFGTHWQQGDDPSWRDPVTGEPGMPPEELLARERAEQAVLNELNVKIEWLQYPDDVRESLLKSVLANDPIVDIALLWGGSQGTLLGQNIFQPLDDYADIFSDPDDAWMLSDEMFGHHYFLNYILDFVTQWPLVYNMAYLDQVDGLKENGKTIYPHNLWQEGRWTWSVFEDYLSTVNEFYALALQEKS